MARILLASMESANPTAETTREPTSAAVGIALKLPFEGLDHPPRRSRLGQPVVEMADRVLVGRQSAEIEAKEARPGQAVPDHELHLRVAESKHAP